MSSLGHHKKHVQYKPYISIVYTMKKHVLIIILFCLRSLRLQGQIAGTRSFAFLNMPVSARQVALGSNLIGAKDNDISLAWNNPAALNPKMHNHFLASYDNYISDIKSGY